MLDGFCVTWELTNLGEIHFMRELVVVSGFFQTEANMRVSH